MNELIDYSTFSGVILYRYLRLKYFKPKSVIATECRHETALVKDLIVFGETITADLSVEGSCEVPYCHDCIEKMIIRCARCGRIILPGDSVSIAYFEDNVPEYAVPYKDGYLGCLKVELFVWRRRLYWKVGCARKSN